MHARFRERLTYANVAATLALFLALTGGVALAAITSRDIKNDTITLRDLNLPVGADGVTRTAPVAMSGKLEEVASTTLRARDGGGFAAADAVVELANSGAPATVDVQLIHKGHPEHTRTFTTEVPAGATITSWASIMCDAGIPAGKNVIILKVSGPDQVTVQDRTLSAYHLPKL